MRQQRNQMEKAMDERLRKLDEKLQEAAQLGAKMQQAVVEAIALTDPRSGAVEVLADAQLNASHATARVGTTSAILAAAARLEAEERENGTPIAGQGGPGQPDWLHDAGGQR